MSLEIWTTIASVGTFVVITATAIAAVIQLYHIRSSNQIAILTRFREEIEKPEFSAALDFARGLDDKLKDPAFRSRLEIVPLQTDLLPIVRVVGLCQNLGLFVRQNMLDAELICDLWAPAIYSAWCMMAKTVVIMRRTRGPAYLFHFEYLAAISKQYLARTVKAYPRGVPQMAPPDEWLAEDQERGAKAN